MEMCTKDPHSPHHLADKLFGCVALQSAFRFGTRFLLCGVSDEQDKLFNEQTS